MHWKSLAFREGVATNFETQIVRGIREFCSKNIDTWTFLLRVLPWPWAWNRAGNALEGAYRSELFNNALLADLPDRPTLVIAATNLFTGAPFSFRKHYAGDYRYGRIKGPSFRLSEAVAASSAFPPFFSPFRLRVQPHRFEADAGTDLHHTIPYALYLSDGGVTDNLGLDYLWKRYPTLLLGDAGAPAQFEKKVWPLWTSLTKRALEIATYQIEPLRRRLIIDAFVRRERRGAYWAVNASMDWYPVTDALQCDRTLTTALGRMRTRLNRFTDIEQFLLVNWGYAVSDAAVRSHLLSDRSGRDRSWPYPDYALDRSGLVRHLP